MIRLYYKNLSGDCSYEQSLAMYGCLEESRQEKISRLKNPDMVRKQTVISYFLQEVLSKEAGIPMESICYDYGEWGKPRLDLEDTRIHFNISHSGEYVVVAISDYEVGVDIEYKSRNYQGVARRCFLQEEYDYIMDCESEEERKLRFLNIWTMKEAFIKQKGIGLSLPLNSFNVLDSKNQCQVVTMPFTNREVSYVVSVCGIGKVQEILSSLDI